MKNKIMLLLLIGVVSVISPPAEVRAEESKTIDLFNGKDLEGWYTYLKNRRRNEDPKAVFSVRDGLLRVSGEEWGSITTDEEYENYVIELEFKTGTTMFGSRDGKAFDTGLLIHSIGKDGAFEGAWMHSIEVNIIDGGCGDLLVVVPRNTPAGFSMTSRYKRGQTGFGLDFDPDGEQITLSDVLKRINRIGRDPEWKDVAHFRDGTGLEKDPGEWNVLRCIAEKDTITVYLNGNLVNRAWNVNPRRGRIQIQSEGAEYYFKRIALTRL